MSQTLGSGQYYGTVLRRLDLGAFVLAETRHRARSRIPPHSHRNAYFCFVRQGSYVETFGRDSRDCVPLTVAFHTQGETHSERLSETDVSSLNVELSEDWLGRVREAAPELCQPAHRRGGAEAWLAARLYREFRWGDSSSRLMIEGLLLELAAHFARAATAPPAGPPWLRRVRELIRERFRENLSPSAIAAEVGTHPVYLASVFRKHFGRSVGEYQRDCRVEFAAIRLARHDEPLAGVAAEAGFADQSHFTRVFKLATGMTPAAFRRALTGT